MLFQSAGDSEKRSRRELKKRDPYKSASKESQRAFPTHEVPDALLPPAPIASGKVISFSVIASKKFVLLFLSVRLGI